VRIILSRKGFDSSSGGSPSPILPDGRMVSLPIPDKQSTIRYRDIRWQEFNLGSLVAALTRGRIPPSHFAHLDPDLSIDSLSRSTGWRPIFGQTGAAQGHLRNNNIQSGDVFLFFGLFQNVALASEKLVWDACSAKRHVLWGWLQVDEVVKVDDCAQSSYLWARYHPHFHRKRDPSNTVYVARRNLTLPVATPVELIGAGTFPNYSEQLVLTDSHSTSASQWKLPEWFLPRDGKTPLTYHADAARWKRADDGVRLNAVARGQEFIMDTYEFPEAVGWLVNLLRRHQGAR